MFHKLVVGIPTYNRHDKCYLLLQEIGSINGIFNLIEIVVVDNSTVGLDKLSSMINKLEFSENITYVHNGEDKGLDWSILSLIDIAKNKSAKLWFLCDDDSLNLRELVGFVKFVQSSKSAVNVCRFDFRGGRPKAARATSIGSSNFGGKSDYMRASFLPTLAIDATLINTETLRPLVGTNYIHLAVLNSLIISYCEVSVYLPMVGVQSPNPILTFSLRSTFLKGYVKCLYWQSVIPHSDIKAEARERCKGYMGVMIKGAFGARRAKISPLEVLRTGVDVFKVLGVLNFLLLLPRLIALFFIGVSR